MSTSTNANDDEIPSREVAYRLFAAEYDDASLSHTESDEERAPNYVVTPTGARTNRLFVVGTLTEVTDVNDEMVRARVVDPTGAFVVYAGQYQPDELAFLEQVTPPAFVAVTGKARTFEPEDGDRVYTSIRPESIATVDAETRDRWVVSAAERTLERVGTYASAAVDVRGDDLTEVLREAGVDRGLAAGIPLAQDHYGTTPDYLAALQECALEAVESVAGERTEVTAPSIGPGDSTPDDDASFEAFSGLVDLDIDFDRDVDLETEPDHGVAAGEPATAEPTVDDADSSPEQVETRAGSADPSTETTADDPAPVGTDDGQETGDGPGDAPTASVETGTESTDLEDSPASEAATDAMPDTSSETNETSETSETSETTATPETETALASADDESAVDDETVELDAETDVSPEDDVEDTGPGMYQMDDDEREQLEAEFGAEFTTGAEVEEPGEADLETESATETATEVESATSEGPADADPAAGASDAESTADDDLAAAPESTLDADDSSSLDSAPQSSLETGADDSEPTEAGVDDDGGEATAVDDSADAADSSGEAGTDMAGDVNDGDEPAAEDVDLQSYVVDAMTDLDDGDGADREALVAAIVEDTGASSQDVEDAIQDALMGGQCYEPDDGVLKAI